MTTTTPQLKGKIFGAGIDDYLSIIFMIGIPAGTKFIECIFGGDIAGCLFKCKESGRWRLEYRHRYGCPQEMGTVKFQDTQDRKSWHAFEFAGDASEEDMMAKTKQAISIIAEAAALKAQSPTIEAEFFEVHGDGEHFFKMLQEGKGAPWMHCSGPQPAEE